MDIVPKEWGRDRSIENMDINFKIENQIGVFSQRSTGWSKELNLVNWNGKDTKFDIREWNPEYDKIGKGITLSEDELLKLYEMLKIYFHEKTIKVNEVE